MPTFSIVVPVYNVAPYLRDCLDGILAQTFADWECICVDDGSTDNSGTILDEYAKRDDRFRSVHQPNAGEGPARNRGLAHAHGEWVLFLDGDDILHPDALERLSLAIREGDDLVRFEFHRFVDGAVPRFDPIGRVDSEIDLPKRVPMQELGSYALQHVYRRERIGRLRFTRYARGCDRVFFVSFLLSGIRSVRILADGLYGYRQRPGSAMNTQPSMQVLLDEMDHRLDIIRMIDASGKSVSYARSVWLEGYFTRGFPAIAGRRKEDRKELIAAWRERMAILRNACGLSRRGNRLARLAANRTTFPLAWLLCYWIPRIQLSIRYRIQIVRRRLFGKK